MGHSKLGKKMGKDWQKILRKTETDIWVQPVRALPGGSNHLLQSKSERLSKFALACFPEALEKV
jgi:hypothetical protein